MRNIFVRFFIAVILVSGSLPSGSFFKDAIAATGDIQSTTIDTEVFNATDGRLPSIVHVSGQIYAVAYRGEGNDGFISTVEIDSDGTVNSSVIDTLEFDTIEADSPDLIKIADDFFAVAYTDSDNDGIVKTIEIDIEGDITDVVVDTLEFDTLQGQSPDIVHVRDDIYAIAYQGDGDDGFVTTVDIDNAGNIAAAVIDTLEFETVIAADASIVAIRQNIFAIAYDGVDFDGFVVTVSIDDTGAITDTVADTLEFDVSRGQHPSIVYLDNGIAAIAYVGPNADGFMVSVDIDPFGNIGSVIDTIEFDTGAAAETSAYLIENDTVAVVYSGNNGDGFVVTIEIDGAGAITNSVLDSFEYETSTSNDPVMIEVQEPVFAIAYSGGSNVGEISTIAIETDSTAITNISDIVSEAARVTLLLSANATDTTLNVSDGSGIVNGDSLFIDDGTNSEIVTVSDVSTNVITVSALTNSYDVSAGTVTIDVLSGVTHTVSFSTTTSSVIDKIRFTLNDTAITDGATLENVTFSNITGVTGLATPDSATASVAELDVTDVASIDFNTAISVDIDNVFNPTGESSNVYFITVETLDAIDTVIDLQQVFFQVGNQFPVTAQADSSFSFTLADDGTQNNSDDSTANATVFLGRLLQDTLDNATSGYGVDGIEISVTTNSINGYSIFINDSQNGLVANDFIGGGRPSGNTDFGIDDLSGSDVAWVAAGTEAYGFRIGDTFDSAGVQTDYNPFSATSTSIYTSVLPVNGETKVITIRAQAAGATPARQYRDVIEILLIPNY
jgi:hypothetical protein